MKKITFLCSLSIAACAFLSLSCKHQNNLNDYQRWSPYMVIDAASFESSHSNACTNSNQCALPLSCSENRCKVPPSIRNEKSDITPTLQYRNPDTSTGTIYLELAKTADEREVGLMFRKYMHPDWGMLFVFNNSDYRSFWMQNTYINLDMLFIRENGSVSNIIENARALNNQERYESTDRVKYVLELPAGVAKKRAISKDTVFVF